MLREIRPTSADEQTSVRKPDRLEEPSAIDVGHIAAAIEQDIELAVNGSPTSVLPFAVNVSCST